MYILHFKINKNNATAYGHKGASDTSVTPLKNKNKKEKQLWRLNLTQTDQQSKNTEYKLFENKIQTCEGHI